jgi:hypothetical protein
MNFMFLKLVIRENIDAVAKSPQKIDADFIVELIGSII